MADVYNASIQRVGRVDAHGHVYDVRATLVGYVAEDGRVIGFGAQVAGTADPQGRVFDAAGHPVGELRSDGSVVTWSEEYVGYIPPTDALRPALKGGAALLLLPLVRPRP